MQNLLSLVEIVDADFSRHISSKIVWDLEETASQQFRFDAAGDATSVTELGTSTNRLRVGSRPLANLLMADIETDLTRC